MKLLQTDFCFDISSLTAVRKDNQSNNIRVATSQFLTPVAKAVFVTNDIGVGDVPPIGPVPCTVVLTYCLSKHKRNIV